MNWQVGSAQTRTIWFLDFLSAVSRPNVGRPAEPRQQRTESLLILKGEG